MKKILLAVVVTLLLFGLTSSPKVFIGTERETVAVVDAREGLPLSVEFVHSVQRTPVIEELEFHAGRFILRRTIYQSQGVGLPFDAGDGNFRREGEHFIMDDMNRPVENLELRTGKGTRLTITLDGRKHELWRIFPVGTKIFVRTF
ncbi:MAG: DUF1850 domain-containing protein [Quinella sp. 2Q5]|nr:DUF1850 domain-containing protein [Quinella sp. 2Q5]